MKKYILLMSLFIFFIPVIVFAEEEFTINSIEKLEIIGKTDEESEPTINGKNIDYNIRFYNEGDSIKYKLNVTNNTTDKLVIKDNIMSLSNENVKYELEIPDGIASIDKETSKDLIISITYIKKAKEEDFIGGLYKRSDNIEFTLRNNQLIIGVANTLSNSAIKVVAVALIVLCIFGIIFTKTKANNKITMIFILFTVIALIPNKVDAVKELKFNMIGNITTELNPCFFDGEIVNGTTYQNGMYIYGYNSIPSSSRNTTDGSPFWNSRDIDGFSVTITNGNYDGVVSDKLCTTINKKHITSMYNMFSNTQISGVDTSSYYTEYVKDMQYMFEKTPNITKLDLSNLGSDNLEQTRGLFYLSNVEELNMSHFNLGKISCLSGSSCNSFIRDATELKKIDLSYANMQNLTMATYMFEHNTKLEEVDMSHTDLSKLQSMEYAFYNLTNLKSLKMNDTNFNSLTSLNHLCYGCTNLETFDISNATTPNLQIIKYMFKNCSKLKDVNLSKISLENVTDMSYMFDYCESLERMDLSEFKTPKVSLMNYLLSNCTKLEYANVSNLGSDKLNLVTSMFENDPALKTVIMENFNFGLINGASLFNDSCTSVEYINLNKANLSKTGGYIGDLLNGAKKSVKKIDMKNAIIGFTLDYFFRYADNLEEIDLSDTNFENLRTIDKIFQNDRKLKKIKVTTLNLKNLVTINELFYNLDSIEEIVIPEVNLESLMEAKFTIDTMINLKKVDFSKVSTPNVKRLYYLIYSTNSIEYLDLSGLDFSNLLNEVTNTDILSNASSLETLVTPKANATFDITLPKTMYAKGDTTGIDRLTSNTPTKTILKSEPWN